MKALKHISIGLAMFGTAALQAQNFSAVESQASKDLENALDDLSALREGIADKKIPLSNKLTQLENEVQQERKEFERVVRAADNVDVDLSSMENKVKLYQDENVYLKNLMSSYTKAFNTRIHAAEFTSYKEVIDNAESTLDSVEASDADKLSAQIQVIKAALDRVEKVLGGTTFEGKALGKNGVEVTGNFILAGPVAVFSDGEGNSGFAVSEPNSLNPRVEDSGIGPDVVNAIAGLASSGEGELPIDPSEGDAFKLAQVQETVIEHAQKGGVVNGIILSLAFVALCIAFFKLFEINGVKRPKPGALQQILDNINGGNKQQALDIANSIDGPFGDLLVAGVEHADQEKELLEEVLYERLLAAQPKLERFLAFIALTAASAPLLGLLGTVTGMIQTFKLITVFGTGDAASLSSGISVALITTEFGLYVAIPSLLAQALLTRLAKGKLGEMEQASVAFVNGLAERK